MKPTVQFIIALLLFSMTSQAQGKFYVGTRIGVHTKSKPQKFELFMPTADEQWTIFYHTMKIPINYGTSIALAMGYQKNKYAVELAYSEDHSTQFRLTEKTPSSGFLYPENTPSTFKATHETYSTTESAHLQGRYIFREKGKLSTYIVVGFSLCRRYLSYSSTKDFETSKEYTSLQLHDRGSVGHHSSLGVDYTPIKQFTIFLNTGYTHSQFKPQKLDIFSGTFSETDKNGVIKINEQNKQLNYSNSTKELTSLLLQVEIGFRIYMHKS